MFGGSILHHCLYRQRTERPNDIYRRMIEYHNRKGEQQYAQRFRQGLSALRARVEMDIISREELAEFLHGVRRMMHEQVEQALKKLETNSQRCTQCGYRLDLLCMHCDNNGIVCANPEHCVHARIVYGIVKRTDLAEYFRIASPKAPANEIEQAVKEHERNNKNCDVCKKPMDLLCLLCERNGKVCPDPAHCKHSREPELSELCALLRRPIDVKETWL